MHNDVKPLFSSVEQLLIREGLQKIINECDEHVAAIQKGQQHIDDDTTLVTLVSIYTCRKEQCNIVISKLSVLRDFSPLNAVMA